MGGVKHVIFTVPSQFIRQAYQRFQKYLPKGVVSICASTGIELDTLMTMSEVCQDVLADSKPKFAMLSGPSFACEVIRKMPAAVTVACKDKKAGKQVQELLPPPYFRVYTSSDGRGVELGGAVKNSMRSRGSQIADLC